ncbi:xanthine dehydrogenase small subunit [Xylophilus ampelinus]|uniref:Xanthine dehydrogenase small subunit n=1 Tax=Xylophilus ampelinus TaxID=54067 RepID=A0A318SXJ1_9BURK|nr:FAD binding domain-containing protein [Xylophilus ampelinus]MCS4509247.1 FAD binding domain-containing protein [Xylophilus ampelinus]PYE79727.1 xanthine dehydrogenase small subunit [Xylophilus ampelinus]
MHTQPLRFLRRGKTVTLAHVPPDRTLLDLLREDLHCTGTKEGCGEGDCGACTVVVGERRLGDDGAASLEVRAVNSCTKLAHSVDGMALWTVEDLAASDGTLHPAQEALVQCHGSQCGFCTPGFVMSLFGMYQNRVCRGQTITRAVAQEDLSGNLCRCTGYRPILEAAERMAMLPPVALDHGAVLSKLEHMVGVPRWPEPDSVDEPVCGRTDDAAYIAPTTLPALLAARAARPQAQLVAGCTDVGLWVTKQHRRFAQVIDTTRAAELRRIARAADGALRIGAAATLQAAYAALSADRPAIAPFAARFASLPVRNAGTLGGNVANGSPIGDSMPLLIALGAQVVLASVRGQRSLAVEDLYTGYRQNVMAPDEIVAYIDVPAPDKEHSAGAARSAAAAPQGPEDPAPPVLQGRPPRGLADHAQRGSLGGLYVFKISKRQDDDISAVCLAIRLVLDADGTVRHASIGAGGVAAVPSRARQAEAALVGRPWKAQAARAAGVALQAEFQPISDMRASGGYRRVLLANLMQRCWRESQGQADVRLESLALEVIR